MADRQRDVKRCAADLVGGQAGVVQGRMNQPHVQVAPPQRVFLLGCGHLTHHQAYVG
jgi:hypothetical protein